VRITEIVIWKKEFIVVAFEYLFTILPKDDSHDAGE
jgi:hypothetical protein